jgi:hypothetical protein
MYACASVTETSGCLMGFLNAVFKFTTFWAAFAGTSCEFLFQIGYAPFKVGDLLGRCTDLIELVLRDSNLFQNLEARFYVSDRFRHRWFLQSAASS